MAETTDRSASEVLILMGSASDWKHLQGAVEVLREFGIAFDAHVSSAHRTPERTVELVKSGQADIILKGDISTPVLNRAILRLRTKNTMGLVTMFDAAPLAGNRPMFITDPGVTTECTYGRLVDLIENACDVSA